MLVRQLFLIILGICSGIAVSAGIFSALAVVGLVPRFAGRTHTAKFLLLYENCIIAGVLFGNIITLFPVQSFLQSIFSNLIWLGYFFLILYGVFSGIFTGCLAIAIAEMLNSLPIFARRIHLRHGLGICILAIALGKIAGSIFYFFSSILEIAY